jgi:N6-adenosine-specific RNA methylase IME4
MSAVLVRYNAMCRAIDAAHSVDEVVVIRDSAAAWAAAAKVAKNKLAEARAKSIRVRAELKAGELSAKIEKAAGPGRGKKIRHNAECLPKQAVLAKHGVSSEEASQWERLARLPKTDIEAALAADEPPSALAIVKKYGTKKKRASKESKREQSRQDNTAKLERLPPGAGLESLGSIFATILIDPPWDWGDEGDADQFGRARPDYKTWSLEELRGLLVGKLAMPDAHLYLWITNRSLPKGFDLIEHWGFRYITALTWAKPHFGMGNYFRGQTEHILFGVRGSLPLKRKDVGTIFNWPRGSMGHSSKPIEVYDLIESCSPGPYLEMFARGGRSGWHSWGEDGLRHAA